MAIKSSESKKGFELCVLQENVAADSASVDAVFMQCVDAHHYLLPKATASTRQSLSPDIILGTVPLVHTDHANCFKLPQAVQTQLHEAGRSGEKLGELDGAHNLAEIRY